MSRVSLLYRRRTADQCSVMRIFRHSHWIGRIEEAADIMESRVKDGISPRRSNNAFVVTRGTDLSLNSFAGRRSGKAAMENTQERYSAI